KIKICENAENAIGVISTTPSVTGNLDEDTGFSWNYKYLKDKFGNYIYEGNMEKILNPQYNTTEDYIPRSQRDEWNIVGLLGQIRVLKNQKISSRWIKMKSIDETLDLYLVR